MAFDYADTDAWYDTQLRPLIAQQHWTGIRIDRVEHNDNIDIRILEELAKCDVAIVDLTYARPSVYFEAGYAERSVPVIYTCRSDHFPPFKSGHDSSMRVHFDLSMRNVVRWSSPTDQTFAGRMTRRMSYVARPVVAHKQALRAEAREERQFSALSVRTRLASCIDEVAKAVEAKGFAVAHHYKGHGVFPELGDDQLLVAQRAKSSALSGIICAVAESLPTTDLEATQRLLARPPFDIKFHQPGRMKSMTDLLLLVTLSPLPLNRMAAAYSQFSTVDVTGKHLQLPSVGFEIPGKRLPQFDHVIKSPMRSPGCDFVGITIGSSQEGWIWKETPPGYRTPEDLATPTRTLERNMHIVGLDRPRSLTQLRDQASKVIDEVFG